MADYSAPFTLSQTIVQALTAMEANGNLTILAANPVAISQYNKDTVGTLEYFDIEPTFQWIMQTPITILGAVVNNGKIVLLP